MTVADKPPPRSATLLHPLTGADLATLARMVAGSGGVPPNRWPHVALATGAALGRLPFSVAERGLAAVRARRAGPLEPPVFVVGHWRSGTTHLHNLLSRSGRWGIITPIASGLPWELLTLGTWLRPLLERALPEDRHVDRVAVTPSSPQEDEIPLANMQATSIYRANYFPRHFEREFYRGVFFEGATAVDVERWKRRCRHLYEKIALHQGRRTLLIKNPVYTARLSMLAGMFPGARFVHVRRNPYVVFRSTLHYYRRLLPELALQRFDHLDLPRFVEESYVRVMRAYDEQSAAFGPDRLVEVAFEELEQDPLGVLRGVYGQLELGEFDADAPRIRSYVGGLHTYRKNDYEFDDDVLERVDRSWHPWVSRWGYARPAQRRPHPASARASS